MHSIPKTNLPKNYKNSPKHKPESAGRLMISKILTVSGDASVYQVEKKLRSKITDLDTLNYIYIVDSSQVLKGVISIKELYQAHKIDPKSPISNFTRKKLIVAHPHSNQEKISHLALKHNIKDIPIVDKTKKLLGVVPNDTIMDLIYQEATEDMFRMSGITETESYDDIFQLDIITLLKRRAPWLIIGLFGGILAAGIINQFEEVLAENLIIAAYIPLVVYMTGATLAQMQAFIIRDLAVNPKLDFITYLLKQLHILFWIGLMVSAILYLLSFVMYRSSAVSLTLALSLFLAMFTSIFTGLLFPVLFQKLNLDPANASGPIATIVQDILSVVVYLIIAQFFLL